MNKAGMVRNIREALDKNFYKKVKVRHDYKSKKFVVSFTDRHIKQESFIKRKKPYNKSIKIQNIVKYCGLRYLNSAWNWTDEGLVIDMYFNERK